MIEIKIGVNNKDERGVITLTTEETDIDKLKEEITKAKMLYAHLKSIEQIEKSRQHFSTKMP